MKEKLSKFLIGIKRKGLCNGTVRKEIGSEVL